MFSPPSPPGGSKRSLFTLCAVAFQFLLVLRPAPEACFERNRFGQCSLFHSTRPSVSVLTHAVGKSKEKAETEKDGHLHEGSASNVSWVSRRARPLCKSGNSKKQCGPVSDYSVLLYTLHHFFDSRMSFHGKSKSPSWVQGRKLTPEHKERRECDRERAPPGVIPRPKVPHHKQRVGLFGDDRERGLSLGGKVANPAHRSLSCVWGVAGSRRRAAELLSSFPVYKDDRNCQHLVEKDPNRSYEMTKKREK